MLFPLLPGLRSFAVLFQLLMFVVLMPGVRAGTLEDLMKRGALPPKPSKAKSVTILDSIEQGGQITLVFMTVREPKTRTAIHLHDYSGVTCLVSGEMTLYIEGKEPIRKVAGDCYYMPSGQRMVGFNSGRTEATFFDFFKFAKGGSPLTIVEAGGCGLKDGGLAEVCSSNPYIMHHSQH